MCASGRTSVMDEDRAEPWPGPVAVRPPFSGCNDVLLSEGIRPFFCLSMIITRVFLAYEWTLRQFNIQFTDEDTSTSARTKYALTNKCQ